jgi:hypothetical protein
VKLLERRPHDLLLSFAQADLFTAAVSASFASEVSYLGPVSATYCAVELIPFLEVKHAGSLQRKMLKWRFAFFQEPSLRFAAR